MTRPAPVTRASYDAKRNGWVAFIDGIELRSGKGSVRRFATESAALRKAQNVIQDRAERERAKR